MTALSFVQVRAADAAKTPAVRAVERDHGDRDEQLFFYDFEGVDLIALIKFRVKLTADELMLGVGAQSFHRGEIDLPLGIDAKSKVFQTTAAFERRGRPHPPLDMQDAAFRRRDAENSRK